LRGNFFLSLFKISFASIFFYFFLLFASIFSSKNSQSDPVRSQTGKLHKHKTFLFSIEVKQFFFFKFRFLLQIDVFSHILEELNLFSRAKIFPFQGKNADFIPIKSSIDVI